MQSLQDLWTAAVPEQVPHSLEYPAGTMVDEFDRATAEFADLPALDFFGRQTSYAELREAAYTVAANLAARGVGPGTQVALLMPTCPQHVIAFYGVLLAGGTVVEHNPLATVSELTPMFADHLADVAIVWDAAANLVQNLPASVRPTLHAPARRSYPTPPRGSSLSRTSTRSMHNGTRPNWGTSWPTRSWSRSARTSVASSRPDGRTSTSG